MTTSDASTSSIGEWFCHGAMKLHRHLRFVTIAVVLIASGTSGCRTVGATEARNPSTLRWHQAYDQGVRAIQRSDWMSAEVSLQAARAKGPRPGRRVLFYSGRIDVFNPDYFLGIAYLNQRRYADAEAAFERVTQQNLIRPTDPEYRSFQGLAQRARFENLLARAEIALNNGQVERARADLERALALGASIEVVRGMQRRLEVIGNEPPRANPPPEVGVPGGVVGGVVGGLPEAPPPPPPPTPVIPVPPTQMPAPPVPRPTPPSSGGTSIDPKPVNLEPFRRHTKQLVDGVVGFDYPARMLVNDKILVRLRVSVRKAVEELRASLAAEGRDPIAEAVRLSPRMKAELQGYGFEIKPLSSVEQVIDADDDTTWTWDVRATAAGRQRLSVRLTAVIELEDSEGARDVSEFFREVEVEAIPRTWSENALIAVQEYGPSRDVVWPAIPTIAAAVWAFLFARRKVRNRRSRGK